jgi:thiosulfate dehydrogenase (quinone) large subunit
MLNALQRKQNRVIEDPKFVKTLFTDARFSVLFLVVRVWLGLQWIDSAAHKIGVPGWTETGEALKGYWERAVAIPEAGRPAISFDWYRTFLQGLLDAQAYTWFAKLVAYGELLVGVALIIGAFVGIAAFFGAFMNFNFMLAGSASTNPVLFIAALVLIFAWKTAGFIGLDYFLLNILGTPWNRGKNTAERTVSGRIVPVAAGD